eukprot:TRINITY_DN7710_c0_g1_i1.p1 TRINITY_DN7710_c0_g1~~TRINITY_DN7710_c0_g1_i1.p1  ORF type:complete len:1121 (+),score=310.78 TRINITY_DN7710_c0_g1_i1:87-3449(+)
MSINNTYEYELPNVLRGVCSVRREGIGCPVDPKCAEVAKRVFPDIYGIEKLVLDAHEGLGDRTIGSRMKVGVILGGGLAPGAVELVAGLFAALKRWNDTSELIGFKSGMRGLVEDDGIVVTQALMSEMLAGSGMSCLGTGRMALDEEKIKLCTKTARARALTGIVVLGGSRSMADACKLSQYFKAHKVNTHVLCTAKRAESVVVNPRGKDELDVGYGYDSTTKVYSWLVGNIAADVSSARSSYHFVRLMGSKNSFSVLEIALDVHPNLAFIGEEIKANNTTLKQVVKKICDVVCTRSLQKRNYGVVVFPEAILNYINEMDTLLVEIAEIIENQAFDASLRQEGEYNKVISTRSAALSVSEVIEQLTPKSRELASSLPVWFIEQVSKPGSTTSDVQVEKLFASLCTTELTRRKKIGTFVGKFAAQTHFYGYEARCGAPSHRDCCHGYALGHSIHVLLEEGCTGYMVHLSNLHKDVANWIPKATPLTSIISLDKKGRTIVRNNQISLESYAFQALKMLRHDWAINDNYRFTVGTLSDAIPTTVQLDGLQRQHQESALLSTHQKETELLQYIDRLALSYGTFLKDRLAYEPPLPSVMRGAHQLHEITEASVGSVPHEKYTADLEKLFPHTFKTRKVFKVGGNDTSAGVRTGSRLRIGIVLSGGPAPGGHNVISGLHDFLKARNTSCVCIGFLNGPDGLLHGRAVEVNNQLLAKYRNQGGFNMLGTSRTKIETKEQFNMARQSVLKLALDGLVICGGDDSNTNAALLADYFLATGTSCSVIGMPKTIDADLRSPAMEMSFGFDTTTKVYSTLVANIMMDAQTTKTKWHFVRVMGRSASHIALECALQTKPNYTVISEEVAAKRRTVVDIVDEITSLVVARHKEGKNYGVVVVPEGLIEVTTDLSQLVDELNDVMAKGGTLDNIRKFLTPQSGKVFMLLPDWLKTQLMSERDPHGNVRVSLIESERLLASLVAQKLEAMGSHDFTYWCHFLGYQGRCSLTSNFDSDYCYVLGHLAGVLVAHKATGVIGAVRNLCQPVSKWELLGIPIVSLMRLEKRKGKLKPVIEKKLVSLDGPVFKQFSKNRDSWTTVDAYPQRSQLHHLKGVLDHSVTYTLALETIGNLQSKM